MPRMSYCLNCHMAGIKDVPAVRDIAMIRDGEQYVLGLCVNCETLVAALIARGYLTEVQRIETP